ncbi:hypothetical protein HRbin20_00902 [bacterium HR20]|uniref:Glycosyl hydrolase n=1 Tax=uncultured Bacteroidota bacterium TaxID=152509 RepID=H5SIK7_9BACT|nr:glycosyl hydrolase [uncultured Bacteroidetes bacterium]GBD05321.1 hypothetical protein HRbin20_00902 [bacterium HR20]
MQRLRVAFLWHFHQPDYRRGKIALLPWVRLHATKDYAELPAIHREFPSLRVTYNVSPILVEQLEEYAAGQLSDEHAVVASLPEHHCAAQPEHVIGWGFIGHAPRMIEPFDRYRALWEDAQSGKWKTWSEHQWLDLQVWMRLAWLGTTTREIRSIAKLLEKGSSFTADDRAVTIAIERELLSSLMVRLRGLAAAGLADISCSPYYHPILPLLCDTDIVATSDPDIERLEPRFAWPEDALEQLRRARAYIEQQVGISPRGIWPSEGSISDAALAAIARSGAEWTASDQALLERSIELPCTSWLYQPFVWESSSGQRLTVFFRDHALSDAIGFVYSSWDAHSAVRDFLERLDAIRTRILDEQGAAFLDRAVVTVILDGENCWEYYESNGAPFLRALYGALTSDERFETVLLGECARRALDSADTPVLRHIAPGSWIGGSFRIWIGDEEDRSAWSLLRQARHAFEEQKHSLTDFQRGDAYRHILAAEGSDWFWWFGPEHRAAFRSVFDELFREHLRMAWTAMGMDAPAELTQPIMSSESASSPWGAMHPATAPTRSRHGG